MRISDWSSDVCSSDLARFLARGDRGIDGDRHARRLYRPAKGTGGCRRRLCAVQRSLGRNRAAAFLCARGDGGVRGAAFRGTGDRLRERPGAEASQRRPGRIRSEEHTSELQSLMRISYAVFCLKKKKHNKKTKTYYIFIRYYHNNLK